MNPIARALSANLKIDDILQYVVQRYPHLKEKLTLAMDSGYSVNDIVSMLKSMDHKSFKKVANDPLGRKERQEIQQNIQRRRRNLTQAEEAQKIEQEKREEKTSSLKKGLLAGAGIVGAGPAAFALSRALPQAIQKAPELLQKAISPLQGLLQGKISAPLTSPQAPDISVSPITGIIEKMGDKVKGVIKSLAGKENPEAISAVLEQHILSPGQKKWLSEQTKEPLSKIVSDYLSQNPQEQITESVEPERKPFEVSSEALLPSGDIGTIKSINKGVAKLDVNGKERHVKEEDLEDLPLPSKDLADLLQDLLSGIEKHTGEEVSRMASFVGYDPKANELAFRPHTGATYTYTEISPEDVKVLTSVLNQRKTTGENYIGAWRQGSKSPIGSAMSALIKKLQAQAGGKGKEYARKFEPVYDVTESAHIALKKKKKEKINEERKKRKAQKPNS